MKLYAGRVNQISEEIVRSLRDKGAIEVLPESLSEAQLDVAGVLREYLRVDRDISQRARELSDQGKGAFGRIKRQLARDASIKVGDEAVDYLVDQLIETFLHSLNVEEIFADDLELRRIMATILKRHTADIEGTLDEEVQNRIKNLERGSVAWDSEYERVMQQLKREKKLD
jgi:hypothetical protein